MAEAMDSPLLSQRIEKLTRALVAERELPRVLAVALDQLLETMGLSTIGVFLIDEARMNLSLVAHRGMSPEMVDRVANVPVADPSLLASRAVAEQKPQFASDVDTLGAEELRVHK